MNSSYSCAGPKKQKGYTLAGALVLIAIMSIFMALSVPMWQRIKQRENENELLFRGQEYVEAIARYHARFNSYPPDLDTLYKQKFIRRLYSDPMTKSGKWKVLRPDSLVEAGAAGAINQPGGQSPEGEDAAEDNKEGQIPIGSNQEPERDQQGESSADQKNKDEGEEPETEVIGPVVGVVSRSKRSSIRLFNGQGNYNKWVFAYSMPQQQGGPPGGQGGKDKQKSKQKQNQQKPSDQNSQDQEQEQ